MAPKEEKKKKKTVFSTKKINPSNYIELNPTVDRSRTMGEEAIDEDYLEEKIRPMSYSERIKRAQTMRRYSNRIQIAKEKAAMRRASPEKIRSRARKRALEIIRARILKNKHYSDLSSAEKTALDKRLVNVPDAVIGRIVRKITPEVKKADAERLQRRHRSSTNEHFESLFVQKDINDLFEDFAISIETHNVIEQAAELMDMVEGTFVDRAKSSIETEKRADALRHHQMVTRAKRTELNKKAREKDTQLRNEESEVIKQLAAKELERKKLFAALHDYSQSAPDLKYASTREIEKVAKAAIANNKISGFTHNDLISLHNRIANARSYRKAFDVFDAMESTDPTSNTPYDREWGTDSLTDTYKEATPGQSVDEESKGLWHNIRQRRSKGLRRLRPGEKNYPATLDIDKEGN